MNVVTRKHLSEAAARYPDAAKEIYGWRKVAATARWQSFVVIRSDEELAEYTAALFALTAKPALTLEEEEAIELLTLLIDRYETAHYPMPDVPPVEMLRFLLERKGLTQRDLAEELGSETTVSLVLAGKRPLTRDHIARLSERFHVSPAVFFGRDEAQPTA